MRSRLRVGITALVALCLTFGFGIQPANAFNRSCGDWTTGHCYSTAFANGSTQFQGIKATINEAPMSAQYSTASEPYFITSEVWLRQEATSNRWIETGFFNGFVGAPYHSQGYVVFNAYVDATGSLHLLYLNSMGVPDNADHSFQLSRGGTPNSWNSYFDGSLVATWSAAFSTGTTAIAGGEMATRVVPSPPEPYAGEFNVRATVQGPDGVWRPMLANSATVATGMNGRYTYPGIWRWSAP